MSGETRLVQSKHELNVSVKNGSFEINVMYQEDTQTYHIYIVKEGKSIQQFAYQVTYDSFNRPKVSITYTNASITNTFELSHVNIRKQTTIAYRIRSNQNSYQGVISVELKWMPNPRFIVTLRLDDGQTFTYQYNRPNRIQQTNNHM
jgi:hypothetical protein